jgi:hypothetical protein
MTLYNIKPSPNNSVLNYNSNIVYKSDKFKLSSNNYLKGYFNTISNWDLKP